MADVELPIEKLVQRSLYEALLQHGEPVGPSEWNDETLTLHHGLLSGLPASATEYMQLYRLNLPDYERRQLFTALDRKNWIRPRYNLKTNDNRRMQHVAVNRIRPHPPFFEPSDRSLPLDETSIHHLLLNCDDDVPPSVVRFQAALRRGELRPWVFPVNMTIDDRAALLASYMEQPIESWPTFDWISNPDSYGHFCYGDFSSYDLDEDTTFSRSMNSRTFLYSVDLRAVRFKHAFITDGSDPTRKKHQYRIYDNIRAVAREPAFFSKLMHKPQDTSDGKEPILPVMLYVLNGNLCAHEHKRIVACLAAGETHLPCTISQVQDVITARLSTYHWIKWLFSREEKSMVMFIDGSTEYYWMIGPAKDQLAPVSGAPLHPPRELESVSATERGLQSGYFYDVLDSSLSTDELGNYLREQYRECYLRPELEKLQRALELESDKDTKARKKKGKDMPESIGLIRARAAVARVQGLVDEFTLLPSSIEALLEFELAHLGNCLWFFSNMRCLQPLFNQLLEHYPRLGAYVEKAHPPHLAPAKHIRYGKTPYPFLEQLVLCLRSAYLCMLYTGDEAQAKQAYTLVEIRAFQQHIIAGDGVVRTRDGRNEGYHYLGKLLEFYLPREVDNGGLLTPVAMQRILALQKPDHLRIFAKEIDGVTHYGCYQGLWESSRYEHLLPVPPGMRYAIHLTKPPERARRILNREPTGRGSDDEIGMLLCLGRYLHSFGHANVAKPTLMCLDTTHWPSTARLRRRFADRCGIGVDLDVIRKHYGLTPNTETAFFGLNEVGTLVILRSVPNAALMGLTVDEGAVAHAAEGTRLRELPITDVFSGPNVE